VANVGIGDEVIVTGQVRELQLTDPRKVRIVYEKGPRWYDIWLGNPRIAQPDEVGEFHEWCPRVNYLRPYIAEKTRERWTWKRYRPPRGDIYFTASERAFAEQYESRVVIDVDVKAGASPNKRWPQNHWWTFAKLLKAAEIGCYQLGPLPPAMMPGATFLKTETIRLAAAIVARARAVVCHEGALHHIAAAVGTPAVVIYGGYISPEVTGYEGQIALFAGDGLGCGMRISCQHCKRVMHSIAPEAVRDALLKVLDGVP